VIKRWRAGVTVGVYNTKLEAQQRLEDCERDDLMLETARSLVNGKRGCRSTDAIA
jgi:hypothetical protein